MHVNSFFAYLNGSFDIKGGGAWTAHQSDFGQYLMVDLGSQFTIESIASKGRDQTKEYVKEFKIEYGHDGQDFATYRDKNGDLKVCHLTSRI